MNYLTGIFHGVLWWNPIKFYVPVFSINFVILLRNAWLSLILALRQAGRESLLLCADMHSQHTACLSQSSASQGQFSWLVSMFMQFVFGISYSNSAQFFISFLHLTLSLNCTRGARQVPYSDPYPHISGNAATAPAVSARSSWV